MNEIQMRFIYDNREEFLQKCKLMCKEWEMDVTEEVEKPFCVITDDPKRAGDCLEHHIPYVVVLHSYNQGISYPTGAYCVEEIADITKDYLWRVYNRANRLPWIILETNRLRVREITVEDVSRLYELYQDQEITQYMEDLFEDPKEEIEYTKHYIDHIYAFYGYGMWVIEEKASGKIIGRAGLENKEGFDGLELGFMIGKQYQRKGYAYEACKAILRYAQEELEVYEICALVLDENEPSKALCRKLGFEPSGMRNVQEKDYIEFIFQKIM